MHADAIFATQEVIAGSGSKCLYDLGKAYDSVEYPVQLEVARTLTTTTSTPAVYIIVSLKTAAD